MDITSRRWVRVSLECGTDELIRGVRCTLLDLHILVYRRKNHQPDHPPGSSGVSQTRIRGMLVRSGQYLSCESLGECRSDWQPLASSQAVLIIQAVVVTTKWGRNPRLWIAGGELCEEFGLWRGRC